MKKSKIYQLAQYAVLRDERLSNETKLNILRELQERELLSKMLEENEGAAE